MKKEEVRGVKKTDVEVVACQWRKEKQVEGRKVGDIYLTG